MNIEKEIALLGMIVGYLGFGVIDNIFRYFYLFMALRYNWLFLRAITREKLARYFQESA